MSDFSQIEKKLLDEYSKPLPKPMQEIAVELGMSDSTGVLYYIRKLMKAGMLVKLKKGKYKTVLTENIDSVIEIPFYGRGRCGDGGEFLEDNPEYTIKVNPQLIGTKPTNLLALQAVGDSMEPSITEGDTVIIKKFENFPEVNTSDMFAVVNAGEVLIKKVLQSSGGGFLLSTNPKHEPIPIQQDWFNVVGKVVGVYKSF
jgi:SOS-response transcriptional repressor LexA